MRALARIQRTVDGPNTVDYGRYVAVAECVACRPEDEVRYTPRGRTWLPVVTGRRKIPVSRMVTVVLQRHGDYAVLVAAYAGEPAPPLPGDPAETPESRSFWTSHALVWDGKGELIADCPW